ncbi:MAG: AhpC/TSA family protein [Candidatus Omnitrophica bacterium]|nr:AhpC/TSA family protein [Candidatus Omnitrophota bacterium]
MKSHRLFTFCLLVLFIASPAAAGSLQDQLDAKRDAFAENADPQVLADYQAGIDLVASSGVLQTAKNVGDIAPDFELISISGERIALGNMLKYGPVVLTWYRGEWCPYCNIHLQEYQKYLDTFESAGATLIAISPQTPDYSISTQQKNELGFHVLSDTRHEVAERYGIAYRVPTIVQERFAGRIDLDQYSGESSKRLPLSVTYVIDTDGMISYAFIDPDYKKRAEPEAVLDAVRKLR